MDRGWRRRGVAIVAALALVVLLVASATPAAAHEGHAGPEPTETTTQQESGGFDLGRIGIALGAGAVAAGVAGAALWLRSG